MNEERFAELKSTELIGDINEEYQLNYLVVRIVSDNHGSSIFLLKFHIMNYLPNYLGSIESVERVDVSMFKQCNVCVKQVYCPFSYGSPSSTLRY